MSDGRRTIGVLGGTGPQGSGLALRWAAAGLPVVIGSRDVGRAEKVARELAERAGLGARSSAVTGADNLGCAARADIVLVAVPWDGHDTLLTSLRGALIGKIRISSVEPTTSIGDIITNSLARGVQVQPGDTVVYAGNTNS